jgi:hypothetical protein
VQFRKISTRDPDFAGRFLNLIAAGLVLWVVAVIANGSRLRRRGVLFAGRHRRLSRA